MIDTTAYDALRPTRLAAELSDDECRVLANLVTLRNLKQGEVLAHEGTVDNHLYVILARQRSASSRAPAARTR